MRKKMFFLNSVHAYLEFLFPDNCNFCIYIVVSAFYLYLFPFPLAYVLETEIIDQMQIWLIIASL